jgi:hypothetical protein
MVEDTVMWLAWGTSSHSHADQITDDKFRSLHTTASKNNPDSRESGSVVAKKNMGSKPCFACRGKVSLMMSGRLVESKTAQGEGFCKEFHQNQPK